MNMDTPVRTATLPSSGTLDRLDEIHGLLGAIDIMAGTLEGYQAETFSRVVQAAQDKVEALQAAIRAAPEATRPYAGLRAFRPGNNCSTFLDRRATTRRQPRLEPR